MRRLGTTATKSVTTAANVIPTCCSFSDAFKYCYYALADLLSILILVAGLTSMSSSVDPEPPASIALALLSVPETNDWKLVFDANIVIVSVFGFFVLACLPRAVARICSVEWHIGHTLRHTRLSHHRNRAALTITASTSSSSNDFDRKSDESHSYQSHSHLIRRRPDTTYSRFPLHQPALSSRLHPVAWHLRPRISPGFCCGQALILVLYAGVLMFASLRSSNIFTDPVR